MPDPVASLLPAGDPPAQPPAGDPPAAPETPEQLKTRLAAAEAKIRDLNHENAERRTKLANYEKAEADRATAALSETEKLTKRAEEAEKAKAEALNLANARLLRAEVIAKAAALKFAEPADALALIDQSKLSVSDTGEVTGAEELLRALAAAKPYLLVKAGQAPLHTGNPGAGGDVQQTDQQKLDAVYGNSRGQFDPAWARAHGGGVFVNSKND